MANFRLVPEVLLNGTAVPADEWSVDINAYSLSSSLEAKLPMAQVPGFAALPDLGAALQKIRPYPFEIRCGISSTSTPAPIVLEKGFVDERNSDYTAQSIEVTGRGTASLLQDIQVSTALNRSRPGSELIAAMFAKYAPKVPLTVTAPSPQFAGKTIGDDFYALTTAGRTAWDDAQGIALLDGFRLTVHAGKATYGPPNDPPDPILAYNWGAARPNGSGIIGLSVRQSPRRSHVIKVVVRSYLRKSRTTVVGMYGHASATEGETFTFPTSGLTRAQAQQKAQAIFKDLARKEFIVTAKIAPDEAFVNTVSQYGANFSIQLGGDVQPSEQLTYGVRQVGFAFNATSKDLPLVATVLMGNLNPIEEGATLS